MQSPERRSGCGVFNFVFGKSGFQLRRLTSTGPVVMGNRFTRSGKSSSASVRRRGGSEDVVFVENSAVKQRPVPNGVVHPKLSPQQQQQQKQTYPTAKVVGQANQIANQKSANVNQGRKVPKEAIGLSGELEILINEHKRSKGAAVYGNLGNLRQPTGSTDVISKCSVEKTGREERTTMATATPNESYPKGMMGNTVRKQNDESPPKAEPPPSLCRVISTRMDPEELKIMGNEDYKNGNYAEALALYDAAISIDPNKASYRSNKSAALTALGRIIEALIECREAIRIEPRYHRAHHRLASLYTRLGEVEKAIYHYKQAGPEADPADISKTKALQSHLNKCTEARRLRNWNALVKETEATISSGIDSAPQIYALQAEAYLKLRKHQKAEQTLANSPNFEIDDCTKFLGPIGNANVLMVRAQVNLAVGRFEDALDAAQRATRLDANNKEANAVMRKAKAVAAARSKGNQLFKEGKFYEASAAYGEGLECDPFNSVLLCNRAACRWKLGQYEKALEDCNAALSLRPDYSKARLRRADCFAKLEKLEASIEDYEILQKEAPEDEEVARCLMEVKSQLQKQPEKA